MPGDSALEHLSLLSVYLENSSSPLNTDSRSGGLFRKVFSDPSHQSEVRSALVLGPLYRSPAAQLLK